MNTVENAVKNIIALNSNILNINLILIFCANWGRLSQNYCFSKEFHLQLLHVDGFHECLEEFSFVRIW